MYTQQAPPSYGMQGPPAQNGPSYGGTSFSQGGPTQSFPATVQPLPAEKSYSGSPQQQHFPSPNANGPSQLPPPPFVSAGHSQSAASVAAAHNGNHTADLPPLKSVFGISLDDLFKRDGSAVPIVVYQCLQAVDLFGLEVEGIYRLSGTASHVTKLRAIFDNGENP